MACTRDINSKENYCLEQKAKENINNNLQFYNSPNGHAFNTAYPELYRQGYMPPDNFSFNSIDIESSLLGIGSCNLVNPQAPAVPRYKSLPTVSFFNIPPVVKEKTFVPLLDQRPFICR